MECRSTTFVFKLSISSTITLYVSHKDILLRFLLKFLKFCFLRLHLYSVKNWFLPMFWRADFCFIHTDDHYPGACLLISPGSNIRFPIMHGLILGSLLYSIGLLISAFIPNYPAYCVLLEQIFISGVRYPSLILPLECGYPWFFDLPQL